jgi:hypothetical protein
MLAELEDPSSPIDDAKEVEGAPVPNEADELVPAEDEQPAEDQSFIDELLQEDVDDSTLTAYITLMRDINRRDRDTQVQQLHHPILTFTKAQDRRRKEVEGLVPRFGVRVFKNAHF